MSDEPSVMDKLSEELDLKKGNSRGVHRRFSNCYMMFVETVLSIDAAFAIHVAHDSIYNVRSLNGNSAIVYFSVRIIFIILLYIKAIFVSINSAVDFDEIVSKELERRRIPYVNHKFSNYHRILYMGLILIFAALVIATVISAFYAGIIYVVMGPIYVLIGVGLIVNIIYAIFSLYKMEPDIEKIIKRSSV
ncbi:MAG: hypothetical protein FWE11_05480 [Defluviitaleaceae bacterium]|nr:hypothetical protein [Defluviitaleaceae bacterium]